MNFHEFTTQVISEMRRRFPGYDIQVQEVPKLQGESYTGMAIHPSGGDIALTMDLEALFDRFRNDLYLGNPMKAIEREIKEAVAQMPQFDTEALTNYERMKEKLTLQLVPAAKNKDLLADIPHRNIEDMALAYRFDIGHNERTSYSILVTNKMLNAYGISAAQLHDDALEAASHSCPATLGMFYQPVRCQLFQLLLSIFRKLYPDILRNIISERISFALIQRKCAEQRPQLGHVQLKRNRMHRIPRLILFDVLLAPFLFRIFAYIMRLSDTFTCSACPPTRSGILRLPFSAAIFSFTARSVICSFFAVLLLRCTSVQHFYQFDIGVSGQRIGRSILRTNYNRFAIL